MMFKNCQIFKSIFFLLIGFFSLHGAPVRVLNETSSPGTGVSAEYFGRNGILSLGDIDGNGADDLLIASYRHHSDTGAIFMQYLDQSGNVTLVDSFLPDAGDLRASERLGFGGLTCIKNFKTGVDFLVITTSYSNKLVQRRRLWFFEFKVSNQRLALVRSPFYKDTTDAVIRDYLEHMDKEGGLAYMGESQGKHVLAVSNQGSSTSMGELAFVGLDQNYNLSLRRFYSGSDTFFSKAGLTIETSDYFGRSLTTLDLENDGVLELAVSAPLDDDSVSGSGEDYGAVYVMHLKNLDSLTSISKISLTSNPELFRSEVTRLGSSLSSGDFDHDGVEDLLISDERFTNTSKWLGGILMVYLKSDGSVREHQWITQGENNFQGTALAKYSLFGENLLAHDFNGDGMIDIIAAAPGQTAGTATYSGHIWVLSMMSKPWLLASFDTLPVSPDLKNEAVLALDTVFGGQELSYAITLISDSAAATCQMAEVSGSSYLMCTTSSNVDYSTIQLEATDVDGNKDSLSFVIAIASGNQLPVSVIPASYTYSEDTVAFDLWDLSSYVTDADAPKQQLTFQVTSSLPTLLKASINADKKTIHIVPQANQNGACSLYVSSTDGIATIRDTVLITVLPVQDAPLAQKDSAALYEDKSADVAPLTNDSDVDGDVLSVSIAQMPSHGTATVDGKTQTIHYVPDADWFGLDTLFYQATDGIDSAKAIIIFEVISVEDLPKIQNAIADQNVDEDSDTLTLALSKVFWDAEDGNALFLDYSSKDCDNALAKVVFNAVDRKLLILPQPDAFGDCGILISGEDAASNMVSDSFVVHIHPVDDVPCFNETFVESIDADRVVKTSFPSSLIIMVAPDSSFQWTLPDLDVDGDTLLYEIKEPLDWVGFDSSGHILQGHREQNSQDGIMWLYLKQSVDTTMIVDSVKISMVLFQAVSVLDMKLIVPDFEMQLTPEGVTVLLGEKSQEGVVWVVDMKGSVVWKQNFSGPRLLMLPVSEQQRHQTRALIQFDQAKPVRIW